MFVKAVVGEFAPLGIGKLINRDGAICSVEYFDAPTSTPIVHKIVFTKLGQLTLPEQTRVYYFNAALRAWEIGRLLDDHGDTQFVRFPHGRDRILPIADVFVRWSRPVADPTPFLGATINETPRFADGRHGFVHSLVVQRAASMGMSALASSAIELEAHQIEVVRRVLQDPVQRYLLADEVGLGKTIEVGILIRQCFLDSGDDATVVVIAPEALVSQWKSELTSKFFLGHLLDRSLYVLGPNDADAVAVLLCKANMLVIDEAQHVTGYRTNDDSNLYAEIAAAAPNIERVFLLSATPAIHNERGFLKMLHLLDPDTYPLDDEEGFRRKIESRQALAEIVAGLTTDNVLFLDQPLDQVAALFPDDALLQEHIATLRASLATIPNEDDPDLIAAIGQLRAHLSEVYRLHRRILRHRRRSVLGLTPDRAGATVVDYSSPETGQLYDAIEDWRFALTVPASRGSEERVQPNCERAFAQVVDRFMQYALGGHDAAAHAAGESDVFGDAEAYKKMARLLEKAEMFEARLVALVEVLRPSLNPRQQFVVFCSDPNTADALSIELATRLRVKVERHRADDDAWLAFNVDQSRRILVCDRSAEEGLNLQGGQKVVVHYDLPLNANRIEQRLGRVDRYGSGDAVRSIVLRCVNNPIEGAWIEYMERALLIFDRSIASLQYLLDDMARALAGRLFSEGAEALSDLTQEGAGTDGTIEREMRAIDQQDALNSLGTPPGELLEALSDVDDDWKGIEQNAKTWIEGTLLFSRNVELVVPGNPNDTSPFRYRYSTRNPHTLVTLDNFYTNCRSAVDRSNAAILARMVRTVPLTYRRRTALSRQGRDQTTRLLRYGDPFVTGMWTIAQNDDRGRSTAVWRHMPDYRAEGVADLFFRFDFLVEADTTEAQGVLRIAEQLTSASVAAIVRRGDMALPPFFRTIWLDRELEPVEDGALLARLELAYRPEAVERGGRDFNLDPQRWSNMRELDIPELGHWSDLCVSARTRSEGYLRSLPSFVKSLNVAANTANEVEIGRLGQLRARAERGVDAAGSREWELECALSSAIADGIRAPAIKLDAILACFISGNMAATAVVRGGP